MYGVFQFNPGPATRANFPSRCTMATCAVSTVKNEPRITLKTKKNTMPAKMSSRTVVGSMFALLIALPDFGGAASMIPDRIGTVYGERGVYYKQRRLPRDAA